MFFVITSNSLPVLTLLLVRYSDYNGDESNDGGSSYSYDGLDITGSAPSLPRPRLYSNIDEEDENKMPVNLGSFMPDRVGRKKVNTSLNIYCAGYIK